MSEGLSALDSYQAKFTMSFDGKDEQGNPQSGGMSFVEEFSKNPPAKRISITSTGSADTGQGGSIESIEVGGKSYSIFGDICASADAAEAPSASGSLTPSSVIGDIRTSRRVGVENINGVSAGRYVLDLSSALTLGLYTDVKGEAWIADPGGFVVKYVFEATGRNPFFAAGNAEGTLRYEYEVTDINQPVNITAPENCGGASEDIPLMPDASDVSALGSTTVYNSSSAFADVVAFYKAQMPANGWTETLGGLSAANFAQLNFSKDGRTASVTVTFDASSNRSNVLISVSGE